MAKDKAKKNKLPAILEGPISPLGLRRDYDSGEIKADMIKTIDMNNPPPVPPPIVKIPIDKPVDYDSGCPIDGPILEETYGEDGAIVSVTVCPVSKSASSKDIDSLADRIRGLIRQGQIITWDIVQDVNTSLDQICNQTKKLKKQEKD